MKSHSELAGFARIFWLLMGPGILLLLGLSIVNRGAGWVGPHDLAYFFVLALVMLARWYEFRENPTTSAGEPATPADLRKFLAGAVVIGVGLWCTFNVLGGYLARPFDQRSNLP